MIIDLPILQTEYEKKLTTFQSINQENLIRYFDEFPFPMLNKIDKGVFSCYVSCPIVTRALLQLHPV